MCRKRWSPVVPVSLLFLVLATSAMADPPTDLIFSEYIEGSSYNKALEIYNGTAQSINLSGYEIHAYHNGNTDPNYIFALEGWISPGEVVVYCNPSAGSELLSLADATLESLGFNGDDALELVKTDTGVIDSFGQVGTDPGSAWGTSPTSTKDTTLVRHSSVCSGDTNSEDVFNPSLEWDGYAQDDFTNLGSHITNCSSISDYIPISEIQTPGTAGSDESQYNGQTVLTQGVVTAVFSTGFYIQGGGNPAWNGIFIYTDTLTPAVGDLIEVEGKVEEYYNLTEIVDPAVVLISTGNALPAPVVLSTNAINDEQWESVLVRVENVTIINDNLGYGEWSVSDGSGEARIDDKGSYTFAPITGETLEYIQGVVDFSFGDFKIQPRDDNDLGGQVKPPEVVKIHEVQGSSFESPLVGNIVTIEGIVVADFQEENQLNGFFIQEEDSDTDNDPLTSEGIFIYNSSYPVSVGDLVQLTGEVTEYYSTTEIISLSHLEILASGTPLPTPVSVLLPFEDTEYLERFEGMHATFPQPLTVSENYNLGRYGELVLSNGRLWNPTNVVSPGDEANTLQYQNDLNRITLDDGSSRQNPDPIVFPAPELSAENTIRSGDTLQDLTGVIHYAYGEYRVEPTLEPYFESSNPRTNWPETVDGNLKVASFNVLNYFTTIDGDSCPYDAGCRGADSEQELLRQRAKIIHAMLAIDADIYGLMELENHPADEPLHDLVQGLNEIAGVDIFEAVYTGAIGTDAIKVGFIYNKSTVSLAGSYAILDSSVDPEFIDTKNRPSLAQTFTTKANNEKVTIAVNHLKSKGSACDDLGDPDMGDGQGNCNLTRKAAAEALVKWLETDPTLSGDPDFLIIGDLNAYAKEDPVTAIQNAGYANLIDIFGGAETYSYVFYGQAGYLDHALANPSLTEQVTGVTEWHINCDEPKVLDYNTEYKSEQQIVSLFSESSFRASDHDPVIITLNLQPAGTTTVCSYLGDNRYPFFPDTDLFTFEGNKGDKITLTLKAQTDEDIGRKKAALVLRDAIKGAHFFKRRKGALPNTIKGRLPANGTYIVRVSELFNVKYKKRFSGNYCLVLNSGSGNSLELTPTRMTE